MSQFIESIKVEDRQIFLAMLHQKRVLETFLFFGKECKIDILEIYDSLNHEEDGLYKFRIEYDLDNKFRTQMIPYAITKIDDFELVENNEIDYPFKSSERRELNKLKEASSASEVIIIKNNQITDSTFSNLLFLKDKQWFTPKSYLLNGTQRQNLLLENKIKETDINLDNIKDFSHFLLINALNELDEVFVYPIEKIINLPQKEVDFIL